MFVLTGGIGFIGSCFLKKLNDNNIHDIIIVDRAGKDEKWKNLVGKRFREYYHKEKFREMLKKKTFGSSIDAIVHLGACTVTTERDGDYLLDNNFSYSRELAEYCLENNVRFIYASSAATYGTGENGYSDSEFFALKPLNLYGLSKHLFDLWVLENKLENKFTGLKFFNVFGPNEQHKGDMASMVYKSYLQIKNTGKVNLFKSYSGEYKDGEQKRDFIYVKDVSEVIWKILNENDFSGIYNLGTGKAHTWNELIKAVFSAMGLEPKIDYIEMPSELKDQYQYFTKADMSKLNISKCAIDFTTLNDSVKDYVQNYLMRDWKYL